MVKLEGKLTPLGKFCTKIPVLRILCSGENFVNQVFRLNFLLQKSGSGSNPKCINWTEKSFNRARKKVRIFLPRCMYDM